MKGLVVISSQWSSPHLNCICFYTPYLVVAQWFYICLPNHSPPPSPSVPHAGSLPILSTFFVFPSTFLVLSSHIGPYSLLFYNSPTSISPIILHCCSSHLLLVHTGSIPHGLLAFFIGSLGMIYSDPTSIFSPSPTSHTDSLTSSLTIFHNSTPVLSLEIIWLWFHHHTLHHISHVTLISYHLTIYQ